MKQITIGELRRSASVAHLKGWLPCEVIADGEVVAIIVAPDVAHLKGAEAACLCSTSQPEVLHSEGW